MYHTVHPPGPKIGDCDANLRHVVILGVGLAGCVVCQYYWVSLCGANSLRAVNQERHLMTIEILTEQEIEPRKSRVLIRRGATRLVWRGGDNDQTAALVLRWEDRSEVLVGSGDPLFRGKLTLPMILDNLPRLSQVFGAPMKQLRQAVNVKGTVVVG